MENNQIKKIAQAAHTSNATVSKVLHHCGGVGGEIRDRVYTYAAAELGRKRSENALPIYVLSPETPHRFWHYSFRGLDETHRVKYNIYSRLGDDAIVLRYLEEAIALRARVIILAASLNAQSRALLQSVAGDSLILFLTEYHDLLNTFYVGSDAASDGRLLADACQKSFPQGGNFLVLNEKTTSKTKNSRVDAFLQATQGHFVCDVKEISLDESRSAPALLARSLAPFWESKAYCGVACFNGYLPQLCLAMRKLRSPLPCFGFEHFPQEEEYAALGYLKATVCQNFRRQLETALTVANDYLRTGNAPASKAVFVPSDLVDYDTERTAKT